jgi:NitT/TauT family transport system ATP-binding protein
LGARVVIIETWYKTVLFVTHDIDEAIILGDRVHVMTARPGRMKAVVDIDIPRPRSLDMMLDPDFIAFKRQIIGLLHDEIDEDH